MFSEPHSFKATSLSKEKACKSKPMFAVVFEDELGAPNFEFFPYLRKFDRKRKPGSSREKLRSETVLKISFS